MPDETLLSGTDYLASILDGVEHIYALQVFVTAVGAIVAVCILLYKFIKLFF